MTDIVILIACSLCGFACGRLVEKRCLRRAEFVADLDKYVALFRANIEGRQIEKELFDREFCQNCSDVFREYMQTGKLRCKLSSAFQKDLDIFWNGLSCVNTDELKKNVDFFANIVSQELKKIQQDKGKLSVYTKLGILLGVTVGIVLM